MPTTGLEFMRGEARQMLEGVLDLGRGGTFQSRTERDIVVRTSLARLEQLDIGDQALYFGRIDRLAGPRIRARRDQRHERARHERRVLLGESFHIGRLGRLGPRPRAAGRRLAGPGGRALLPGHRPRSPGPGPPPPPRRPRAGQCSGSRTSTSSTLRSGRRPGRRSDGAAAHAGDGTTIDVARATWPSVVPPVATVSGSCPTGMVLGGPGALLAALGQARTGHMGDIVGDHPARAGRDHPLAAGRGPRRPGWPGTGKTAVALHRAAYLLYTHRFPLERQGVLVVGPNPLFLRYIEQVLPSLGETGVSLSTVAGLVPEVRVRGVDEPAVAKLKGDVRMVKVLARAVRTRQRRCAVTWRSRSVPACCACAPRRPRRSSALARRRPGTHNARRRFVEAQVVRALADDYRARQARGGLPDSGELTMPTARRSRRTWPRRLRRVPEVAEALDRMWPRLSPHELLHDLFGARPLLAAAGQGHPQRRPRCSGSTARAAPRSTRCPGPWPTPRWSTRPGPCSAPGAGAGTGPCRPSRGRAARQDEGSAAEGGFWPQGLAVSPVPRRRRCAGRRARTRSAPSATSWSTRSRTSRPCSCACWPAARSRAP